MFPKIVTHRKSVLSRIKKHQSTDHGDCYSSSDYRSDDNEYFAILQRGFKNHRNFNRYQYKKLLHSNLRDNLVIGFINEKVLQEELRLTEEMKKINASKRDVDLKLKNFNAFLESDFTYTMNIWSEAENKIRENKERIKILEETGMKRRNIILEIDKLQEPYKKCLQCENFLFSISPESWKNSSNSKHDAIDKALDEEEETELYFKESDELFLVFYELEEICYTIIQYSSRLSVILEFIENEISSLDENNEKQAEVLNQEIKMLEKSLNYYEEASENAKILSDRLVYKGCGVSFSIKEYHVTYAHLHDSFLRCFSHRYSASSELSKIFEALEAEHEKLRLEEDSLSSSNYRAMLMKIQADEQDILSTAVKARRQLKEFDIYMDKSMKLLEPPTAITTRKLMYRSKLLEAEDQVLDKPSQILLDNED